MLQPQLNELGEPLKYTRYGQVQTEFDHFELRPEPTNEEIKAEKERKKLEKKQQRCLFITGTKEECDTKMKELGLEPPTEQDLLNDLPF